MKIFSKNTWGVDVNKAWPLTCKASCLKKIALRPLISGFDFALLEVRNLCVASRLKVQKDKQRSTKHTYIRSSNTNPTKNWEVNSGAPEGQAVPAPLVQNILIFIKY
jgi:hypothetical protein